MRQAILIGLFLLGLVAAGSAQAATLATTDSTVPGAWIGSNADLLQDATWNAGLSNLSGIYGQPAGADESFLRDGSVTNGLSVWAGMNKPHAGFPLGSIWVYNLNTSVNTGGYDLSQVNLFFERNQMAVKVEYSKVGSDAFEVLYDMGYARYTAPSGNGKISITAGAGEATGVDAVRFSWASDWTGSGPNDPNPVQSTVNNGYAPVYEIDVHGVATVGTPVPAPAGLALLGLGSMGLAFIRRRKAQKA
jgi:hypothetical protein